MDKILYKSLHFPKLSQKETKNIKISISIVLFSFITLFVFDAYAQQQDEDGINSLEDLQKLKQSKGGSATSGEATGGAAIAGGVSDVTCTYCTIINTPHIFF